MSSSAWARTRTRVAAKTSLLELGITVVVEYDGEYWHRDKALTDELKTVDLLVAGHRVVRVRENELPDVDVLDTRGDMRSGTFDKRRHQTSRARRVETHPVAPGVENRGPMLSANTTGPTQNAKPASHHPFVPSIVDVASSDNRTSMPPTARSY
jgi:hypothetical protein